MVLLKTATIMLSVWLLLPLTINVSDMIVESDVEDRAEAFYNVMQFLVIEVILILNVFLN